MAGVSGQGTVEFALVVPILVVLVLAIVSAGSLLFNYAAVVNAARQGAREAMVESSLLAPSGLGSCESGQPMAIEAAVQRAATVVPVNPSPLCQSTSVPTELVQAAGSNPNAASVTVRCLPALSAGSCQTLTVTVSLDVNPLFPIPGPIHLAASATVSPSGA